MKKPVILEADDGNRNLYHFQFGAYGNTHVIVRASSVEKGLETAAEWLSDNEPGHLSQLDDFTEDSLDTEGNPIDHTYTECGYLASWEWHVNELEPATDAELAKVERWSR